MAGVAGTGLLVLCVMLIFGAVTVALYKAGEWLAFKVLGVGFVLLVERLRRGGKRDG